MDSQPRYPAVYVRLVGEDGNAFAILARCRRAMLDAELPRSKAALPSSKAPAIAMVAESSTATMAALKERNRFMMKNLTGLSEHTMRSGCLLGLL
jgi:hypothetical protein